jgi:hypothetical protein
MVDFPQGIKDMTRRCGRASFTVELGNRLAIGPAAELQAARQSNQRLLAIVHVSGYTGFESAAQRLSPTSPSSGQASVNSLLRYLWLPACHSRAALDGAAEVEPGNDLPKLATMAKITYRQITRTSPAEAP